VNVSGDDRVACRSLVSVDINDETSHKMLGHFEWFKDFLDRGVISSCLMWLWRKGATITPSAAKQAARVVKSLFVRRLCESGEANR